MKKLIARPYQHPKQVHEAKKQAKKLLLLPNHHGVGIGADGKSIVIYVGSKREASKYIGKAINGIPIQTRITEPIHTLSNTGEVRPLIGGISVSNATCQCAGSLAEIVYDVSTKAPLVLSNYHVLCDMNTPSQCLDIAVVQPGEYDSGTVAQDTVGKVLRAGYISPTADNIGDWALGNLSSPSLASPGILQIGNVTDMELPEVGMNIAKMGRNGYGESTISDVDATVQVSGYPWGSAYFDHQIVTSTGIAQPGDSGSLCVDTATTKGVGLLFAGSNTLTIANPLIPVAWDGQFVLSPTATLPPNPYATEYSAVIAPIGFAGLLLGGAYLATRKK